MALKWVEVLQEEQVEHVALNQKNNPVAILRFANNQWKVNFLKPVVGEVVIPLKGIGKIVGLMFADKLLLYAKRWVEWSYIGATKSLEIKRFLKKLFSKNM